MLAAVTVPDGAVIAVIPLAFAFVAWLTAQIYAIRSNTEVTREVLRNHEERIDKLEEWRDNAMVPAWRVQATIKAEPEV